MQVIGILKEKDDKEQRVSMVPEVLSSIIEKLNIKVFIEADAGKACGFSDDEYKAIGANVLKSREELIKACDTLITIDGCQYFEEPGIEKKNLIGLFDPYFNKEGIKKLKESLNNLFCLEMVPRISRAQSLDVLSSQANIAGYLAVLLSANKLNKIMPLMMTAAGTIRPANVLVIGAGVAGLSAIATAKRLGAVVYAYDVRDAAKEQAESFGAKFIDIKLEESGEGEGGYAKELRKEDVTQQIKRLSKYAYGMDIVITTALIPGKVAPKLLDESIFKNMDDNTVVIDMAAQKGGNVPKSKVDVWQKIDNVWLYGAHHLARRASKDASFTFAKNIYSLLELMPEKPFDINVDDDVFKSMLLCHAGNWINKNYKEFILGA